MLVGASKIVGKAEYRISIHVDHSELANVMSTVSKIHEEVLFTIIQFLK